MNEWTILPANLDRPRSELMEVLYTGEVDGHPMRWFASPTWLETGSPDHPWHSWDDLCVAVRLPEAVRVEFLQRLKTDWVKEVRTVAVAGGSITTAAPHYMAQGLFGMLRYRRKILPTADRHRIAGQYLNGQAKALSKMTAHMTALERFAFAMAGWR